MKENRVWMIPLLYSLSMPLLSLMLLVLGSGLLNTFVPVRLEMEHYSNETIGVVTSALYIGILIGSLGLDRWITQLGHRLSFLGFAIISTLLAISQSFWIDPYYWAFLRILGGICMAGIFIVIESWLLVQASPSMRGAILSIYLAVLYGALSLGQFLINLADPLSIAPFYIVAGCFALSLFPLTLTKPQEPVMHGASRIKTRELFFLSPLGFCGGIVSGILLAAIYGLVPVYAKEIGLTIAEIGNLMALLIFGGLLFQWPLGKWADQGNRRKVLLTTTLVAALISLAIGYIQHMAFLFPLSFLFGGFSFAIYPLSMAYACEKLSEDQIVSATGGFVLSYGIGAIGGPLLAPLAMDGLGSSGLFYFLGTVLLVLFVLGVFKRKVKKASLIQEDVHPEKASLKIDVSSQNNEP